MQSGDVVKAPAEIVDDADRKHPVSPAGRHREPRRDRDPALRAPAGLPRGEPLDRAHVHVAADLEPAGSDGRVHEALARPASGRAASCSPRPRRPPPRRCRRTGPSGPCTWRTLAGCSLELLQGESSALPSASSTSSLPFTSSRRILPGLDPVLGLQFPLDSLLVVERLGAEEPDHEPDRVAVRHEQVVLRGRIRAMAWTTQGRPMIATRRYFRSTTATFRAESSGTHQCTASRPIVTSVSPLVTSVETGLCVHRSSLTVTTASTSPVIQGVSRIAVTAPPLCRPATSNAALAETRSRHVPIPGAEVPARSAGRPSWQAPHGTLSVSALQ